MNITLKKLPPLNSLRYFLVAAQTLSFKKAAEQLFVTQAAISQHIKTLETHIGVQLFTRGTRQVFLTEDGKRLIPYVQAGFENFIKGVALLSEDTNPDVLNVTVVESLSFRWLVPRLQFFQKQYPKIRVRLEPSNKVRDFAGTDIDLAIRFGKGHYPGLESRLFLKDKYVLVCHPSLIQSSMTPQDLYKLPLLEENGPVTGDAWGKFLAIHKLEDLKFNKTLEVDDSTVTIVDAVLAGQGFAMLRYNLIYQQIQRRQLVSLFDFSHPSAYSYYLIAPSHHFNKPKVQLFEKWLIEAIADIH
ncbi:LysR family transcriptional regulator [Paraglaciecola psychrophila 170]|uniref:LysR family transcriptional regulator n=1 Tax=Paraglaciecola psychrophila 170 TaxID=1129794 RepID=K7A8M0_9ALTE|nr:LysR family transcriptional regulator [Paraglaciecola psychrophila 170]GAC38662.1 LysR family transcriptional regulator [Paraglaciecola psychrophila 170]